MLASTAQLILVMKILMLELLAFTKGVTCLSRYGDEMYMFASAECLILSATNVAETSYCRFQYSRVFFTRYNLGQRGTNRPGGSQEPVGVSGQVLAKVSQRPPVRRYQITDDQSLLAVLKRGAGDKTVDKCELSIVDSEDGDTQEEKDSLESKLVVRMHCKHGTAFSLCSWPHKIIPSLLRRCEDTQTPVAYNRVSAPVHR